MKNKIKQSAIGVAFARSLANIETDENLKGPDYMAKYFLPIKYRLRLLFPKTQKRLLERISPGVYWYLNARVRHIESIFKNMLAQDIEQIVILAAGSDSRPYRYKKELQSLQVFEIDLPDAQTEKKKKVSKILGKLPDYVTYIPGDLNKHSLKELFANTKYLFDKKTFFLCEGIFHYLPEATVDSILKFIADSPNSSLVFSYARKYLKTQPDKIYGADKFIEGSEKIKEPCLSSIDESSIESFLKKRGLRLISDVGAEELEQMYLKDKNGELAGKVFQVSRIAHAVSVANDIEL